jgi:hypothetical protein
MSNEDPEIVVHVENRPIAVTVTRPPGLEVSLAAGPGPVGPPGPQGPPGQWAALTQAAFDALSPPDPDVLYVIIAG